MVPIKLKELYFFIISRDPGLSNLRLAVKTTLSATFTAFLVFLISDWAQAPLYMVFLSVTLAIHGSLTITDFKIKDKKITTLLLPIPAAISVLIGSYVSGVQPLAIGFFLLLSYLCVGGRKYGPRFVALGKVAFMCFFATIFFKVQPAHITWIIVGLIVGALITYVFQFLISLSRPEWVYKWYKDSFIALIKNTLEFLAETLYKRTNIQKNRIQLRHYLSQITDTALVLEDLLKAGEVKSNSAIQTQFFETEFALVRLLECVRFVMQSGTLTKEPLMELYILLHSIAENNPSYIQEIQNIKIKWLSNDLNANTLEDLWAALNDLALNQALLLEIESSKELPKILKRPIYSVQKSAIDVYKRHAIQATVAVGLSAIVGVILSPQRWAWAAMTSYLAFSGTNRGDTLLKSTLRILGTAMAIFAGLFLAQIKISPSFDIVLILVCIFFASYMIHVSYAMATLGFTLMVFLLFKFLDLLTINIIILRLEESFIGVFFAGGAAIFILPTYTQRAIGIAVVKLLQDLAEVLNACSEVSPGIKLTEYSRLLDRDFKSVRAESQSLIKGVPSSYSETIRGLIHDAFALVHFGRTLTICLTQTWKDERLFLDVKFRCKKIALKANEASNKIDIHLQENQAMDIFGKLDLESLPIGRADHYSRVNLSLDRIELLIDSILHRFKTNQQDL
jgi:hypothetical protein